MSEFFKQFGLLVIDYLMGFFVSMMTDMRHSIKYRVQEQSKRRNGEIHEEENKIVGFKNKNYRIVCNCNELLILKEIEELPLGSNIETIVIQNKETNSLDSEQKKLENS